MSDIKGQLVSGAMKLMQTDAARKVMASQQFQNAMAFAFRATFKVRNEVDGAKKKVANGFNLVTKDEVRELRRNVEGLERRLRKAEKKSQDDAE